MFRMKQTSSSVHWTLISKPWRSVSYCINLFSSESLWTCSPVPPQGISLDRVICDSLRNMSFWCVFYLAVTTIWPSFSCSFHSRHLKYLPRVSLVQLHHVLLTLAPKLLPTQASFLTISLCPGSRSLAFFMSLFGSRKALKFHAHPPNSICCDHSLLSFFLNVRKLVMLCWVSYPNCLWARFLSQQ